MAEKSPFKIFDIKITEAEGYVHKNAMNSEGFLYSISGPYFQQNTLSGISLEKGVLWKQPIKYRAELRVDKNGFAWIAQNNTIQQFDESGKICETIEIELDKQQEIGSFLILDDGLIIACHAEERTTPNSKVLRVNFSGETIWETEISETFMSYSGVIRVSAESAWKPKRALDWLPRNWRLQFRTKMLISGDNLLVNYHEMPGSGVGMSYCLDVNSGEIIRTFRPGPFESFAALGDGGFLVGHQGYGAFDTFKYDPAGDIVQYWKSVGRYIINESGETFLIEMNNASSSKLYFSQLKDEGEVRKIGRIENYYILDPVIDEFGNIAFYRDNKLQVIDSDFKRYMYSGKIISGELKGLGRMILYGKGTLIFSLENKIYKVQTNMGKLAKSVWPCKHGNIQRNPVIQSKSPTLSS